MEINKERRFSELFNDTFVFVKENFKPLFTAVLVFASPFALVSGFFGAKVQLTQLTGQSYGNLSINMLLMYTMLIIANIMLISVTYGYMFFYISKGKGGFSLDDVWKFIAHHFWKIFSAFMFMLAFVILGMLCFIIPGIYIFVVLLFFFTVVLYEKLDFHLAFLRCLYLIKNKWWYSFGFVLLINAFVLLFSLMLMIPEYVYVLLFNTSFGKSIPNLPMQYALVVTITSFLIFFFQVIGQVAVILLYFNLKVSKDKTQNIELTNQI